MLALKKPVPCDEAARILNMLYAVFLAVFFRFCIVQVIDHGGGVDIRLLISKGNGATVVLLAIYYLFDWLTTNLSTAAKGINYLLLPIFIVLMVWLGGLVAFAFEPTRDWYFWFGLYASLVPWWDLIDIDRERPTREQVGLCLALNLVVLLRLACGIFILVASWFLLWIFPNEHQELNGNLIYLLFCYVALKALRYALYVHLVR
jgi:hypothetical protein